jgi:Capsule polysaccharide biosynthesis protein
MSHVVHPSYHRGSWPEKLGSSDVRFFREDCRTPMQRGDRELLASLEGNDVPTIHNMILSDRVVSRLPYADAIDYASLLAKRLYLLYGEIKPTVVVGSFDALHGSLAFAVARHMRIPWYALQFTALPRGQAAFATDLTPASPVLFEPQRGVSLRPEAERLLLGFESRQIMAAAYVSPPLLSASFILRQIPRQLSTIGQVLARRRMRAFLKYTDYPKSYSVKGMIAEAMRLRMNLWLLSRRALLVSPPKCRFVFFGLHMQPESSVDVFAHFFSNQERVIELIARSVPPTHTILVKLHKSDTSNYSTKQLAKLARFPGVELVSPYADAVDFVKKADLVFAIQGTIGLEAALLGKPVIMFGDSPMKIFPSVSTIGKTIDLPDLVRRKLTESVPARSQIVDSFASYLSPFYPASHNDWSLRPSDTQIDDYVRLFALLKTHIAERSRAED